MPTRRPTRATGTWRKWLDAQLETFDKVYGGKRPRYLDGYQKLKEAIRPWGAR